MNRKLVMVAAAMALTTLASQAATLRVPQQYPTIQAAVEAAAAGDTVVVGPGTYVEHVLIQKSLRLRSSAGPKFTTIDGNGIGSPVAIAGTFVENVTVMGFTLTGGAFLLESPLETPNIRGAGIYVDSVAHATLANNVITGNRGCGGDGIISFFSEMTIRDNILRGNDPMDWCSGNGAAIRADVDYTTSLDVAVERNQIIDNGGVGIQLSGFEEATIHGNTIAGNGVDDENMATGAAMSLFLVGGVISSNVVTRNHAHSASALWLYVHTPERHVLLTGNVFIDNESFGSGNDVYLLGFLPATVEFRRNVVVGDSASELLACIGDGTTGSGNLIVNRNPEGGAGVCGN